MKRADGQGAQGARRTARGRSGQWAVAATLLLVCGTLAVRIHRGNPGSVPTATAEAAGADRASAAPAAPGGNLPEDHSPGSLALRCAKLLSEGQGATSGSPAELELERSRERELLADLKRRLNQEPDRWWDVVEILAGEDPRAARRIVGELRNDVGAPAESVLVRLIQEGLDRESRMAAATLVAGRESSEAFWALHAAAQQDPDAGVRYHALKQLLNRQGFASAPDSAAIDELVRTRARAEPDPEVRAFALRASGQAPPALAAPPAPPAIRSLALRSGFRLN